MAIIIVTIIPGTRNLLCRRVTCQPHPKPLDEAAAPRRKRVTGKIHFETSLCPKCPEGSQPRFNSYSILTQHFCHNHRIFSKNISIRCRVCRFADTDMCKISKHHCQTPENDPPPSLARGRNRATIVGGPPLEGAELQKVRLVVQIYRSFRHPEEILIPRRRLPLLLPTETPSYGGSNILYDIVLYYIYIIIFVYLQL